MYREKTPACNADSGAILAQPRVYPGLIFGASLGTGPWGAFRSFLAPGGLAVGHYSAVDFLGQPGDQLRLPPGGALVGDQGRLGSPAHLLAFWRAGPGDL